MKFVNVFGALSRVATLLAVCSAALFGVAPAMAADVTFVIRNNHPNALEVQLYSQNRSHVWPGPDEVYYLDDGEAKEMHLSCKAGEEICYGAWIAGDTNTYWGVGPGNSQNCSDCCYVCAGGETEEINLEP